MEICLGWRQELAHLNATKKIFFVLGFEWESTCQNDIKNDTEGPYIGLETTVFDLSCDFWWHVGGSTTENL